METEIESTVRNRLEWATTSLNYTHFDLFVNANGRDGDGLAEGRAPLLERDDFSTALVKGLNDAAVMAQVFAQVLHLFQEFLAFVQREFTLAVGAIQQLVLSVIFRTTR